MDRVVVGPPYPGQVVTLLAAFLLTFVELSVDLPLEDVATVAGLHHDQAWSCAGGE
jgi:hypothetical protein